MSTIQTLSTSDTPADTLITKFNTNFANLNADKLEASAIAGKQDTLVSGTNIKTINGVTVLGSGNISIPTLTDGDKGDITLTSSGTVWTIDNDVVTFAKMQNIATNTILIRTTAGTGDIEAGTPAQVAGMLPLATTSVAGTMSATDKSKLDAFDNWNLLINTSFTAGTPYNTGTLTTYDEYKVVINGLSVAGTVVVEGRFNSNSSLAYHWTTQGQGTQSSSAGVNYMNIFTSGAIGTGYRYYSELYIDRSNAQVRGVGSTPRNASFSSQYLLNAMADTGAVTSFQLSTIVGLSGTIKIYGRNY